MLAAFSVRTEASRDNEGLENMRVEAGPSQKGGITLARSRNIQFQCRNKGAE